MQAHLQSTRSLCTISSQSRSQEILQKGTVSITILDPPGTTATVFKALNTLNDRRAERPANWSTNSVRYLKEASEAR